MVNRNNRVGEDISKCIAVDIMHSFNVIFSSMMILHRDAMVKIKYFRLHMPCMPISFADQNDSSLVDKLEAQATACE